MSSAPSATAKVPLGESGRFVSGIGFPIRYQGQTGGDFPFAKVGDISRCARSGGRLLADADHWISREVASELRASVIPAGAIAFAKIGEAISQNFRVQVGRPLLLDNNAIAFIPDPSIMDSDYAYHALRAIDMYVLASTTTVPSLRKSVLEGVEIALPPLPEQRRIAAILDKTDALRAKRREAIAKLDQLLQSVFLDMFGDPVTNPKGWPLRPLGQICDVRDGTHDSPKYVDTGHPLVTSKNLNSGRVDLQGALLISDEDFAQVNKRSKVDRGDLLMPMIGTIGNPVLVDHDPMYAIKNIALLKFDRATIKNTYILNLLKSHFFAWATAQKNRGGTQKFLALNDIRGMLIPVPNDALQEQFESCVATIERQRERSLAAGEESTGLFDALQNQAFS